MATLPFIRLTLNPAMEKTLQFLRMRYPQISNDADFFKIGLSAYAKTEEEITPHRNEIMMKYIAEELDRIAKNMEKHTKGKYRNISISNEEIDANSY